MHWWLTQRRGVGAGLNNEEEKIVAALTVAGEKELVCVGLLPHVWPLHNPRHQTLSNAGETAWGPSHLSPGQSPRVNESKGHRGGMFTQPQWARLTPAYWLTAWFYKHTEARITRWSVGSEIPATYLRCLHWILFIYLSSAIERDIVKYTSDDDEWERERAIRKEGFLLLCFILS